MTGENSFPFAGLANINVELTSRCNKNCWMCGRRKVDRDFPDQALQYGDMDFSLVEKIASETPPDIVVQLHNNGEALLYPRFGEAAALFRANGNIVNVVSNGILLPEKASEIVDNLDTLSISVFENDECAGEQYECIRRFLEIKGGRKPFTSLRLIGDVSSARYENLGVMTIRRVLHSPMGSFGYKKLKPTIPEIGICLDFLNHLAINKDGDVSICVRFDPERLGVLGSIRTRTLAELWNGETRLKWKAAHIAGKRGEVPLCSYCHFWGVPTGFDPAGE